jgi:hypothetical protein
MKDQNFSWNKIYQDKQTLVVEEQHSTS